MLVTPEPIFFSVGPFNIYWYGLLIAFGLATALIIGRSLVLKYGLQLKSYYDLVFYSVIFSLIGARLWHILSTLDYYFLHPLNIFKIWQGGLAIHGAILAGVATLYFFNKKDKAKFFLWLDIFAPLLALGQTFGRWGNYFNQELYGLPSELPWAIYVQASRRLPAFSQYDLFHPLFLYESLFCMLLFGVLFYLHFKRWHYANKSIYQEKLNIIHYTGAIFFIYLALYSLERFFISFLRIDPQIIFLSLRLDQWVSSILFLSAVFFIYYIQKGKKVVK